MAGADRSFPQEGEFKLTPRRLSGSVPVKFSPRHGPVASMRYLENDAGKTPYFAGARRLHVDFLEHM
jgi:hypothetical protein